MSFTAWIQDCEFPYVYEPNFNTPHPTREEMATEFDRLRKAQELHRHYYIATCNPEVWNRAMIAEIGATSE